MKRLYMIAFMSIVLVLPLLNANTEIGGGGIVVAGLLMKVDGGYYNFYSKKSKVSSNDLVRGCGGGLVAGLMFGATKPWDKSHFVGPMVGACGLGAFMYGTFSSIIYVCNLLRLVGNNPDEHDISDAQRVLKRGLIWSSAVALGIAGGSLIAPKLFPKK